MTGEGKGRGIGKGNRLMKYLSIGNLCQSHQHHRSESMSKSMSEWLELDVHLGCKYRGHLDGESHIYNRAATVAVAAGLQMSVWLKWVCLFTQLLTAMLVLQAGIEYEINMVV